MAPWKTGMRPLLRVNRLLGRRPARRSRTSLLAMVLLGTAGAGACASGGSTPRQDRDLITRTQIEAEPTSTAYELIQRLRPQWLRVRGNRSISDSGANERVVYLNGARMGGLPVLRQMGLASVHYIRYLDPSEATYRFGAGHLNGAILLSTEPH